MRTRSPNPHVTKGWVAMGNRLLAGLQTHSGVSSALRLEGRRWLKAERKASHVTAATARMPLAPNCQGGSLGGHLYSTEVCLICQGGSLARRASRSVWSKPGPARGSLCPWAMRSPERLWLFPCNGAGSASSGTPLSGQLQGKP